MIKIKNFRNPTLKAYAYCGNCKTALQLKTIMIVRWGNITYEYYCSKCKCSHFSDQKYPKDIKN